MNKFENEWTREVDRLRAEKVDLVEILRKFIAIDDADKGGKSIGSATIARPAIQHKWGKRDTH